VPAARGPVERLRTTRVGRARERLRAARVQHLRHVGQQAFLLDRALRLPKPQAREARGEHERAGPPDEQPAAACHDSPTIARDNARRPITARCTETCVNQSLKTLLVIAFLIAIIWNLGAGLYYMLVDKGESRRTVNALTRRIVLSIVLILAVVAAAWMGWIDFHGVGSNPVR